MAAEHESNVKEESSERSNETSERRGLEPELLALGRIKRTLDDLSEDERRRAMAWLKDRYQVVTV